MCGTMVFLTCIGNHGPDRRSQGGRGLFILYGVMYVVHVVHGVYPYLYVCVRVLCGSMIQ